ncbi:MAG: HEPN domain-containing protein [Alphaproteobacteria bacterium]|nr:MAG: HEPN domain-containing protein [Alphaproteobacteria bacterium]
MSTAHELAQRWLDTARADLMAARNCLDGPHYLPEIAAYHCQQAAEKLVKAVLIHGGIEPAKSHDIDALVGRLSPADRIRPALEPLGRFTPYAVPFRYPGEDLDPSPPERNDITGWITEIDTAIGVVSLGHNQNRPPHEAFDKYGDLRV